ncbi:MAG: electron transport complex subunit E [Ruminococcaceae bacterium]|nr:electron transport complex subunit E [Oscillospiraceae bacterium]
MNKMTTLLKGIIKENPVLVLLLGTCPTLAVTSSLSSAVGMAAAAALVLICSNLVISLLRNIIPDKVRIPCYIVVIAGFVTVVEMAMHAFFPSLYDALGVFLSLIVVNCIILGRAEMFASKHKVFDSILDGLGMGIGFALALIAMALVREVFGAGTFFGMEIPVLKDFCIPILTTAPGGFFVFGILIALVNAILNATKKKPKAEFGCEGCPSASQCNKTSCDKEAE